MSETLVLCSLSFGLGVFIRKSSIREAIVGSFVFGCVIFTIQNLYQIGLNQSSAGM